MEVEANEESTFRELLTKSGNILDNPFATIVVEKAPSIRAAEGYMSDQGWSNEIAEKVRAAARLKKRGADFWNKIKESKTCTLKEMFYKGEPEIIFPGIKGLRHFNVDGLTRSIENWPLLLLQINSIEDEKIKFQLIHHSSDYITNTWARTCISTEMLSYESFLTFEERPQGSKCKPEYREIPILVKRFEIENRWGKWNDKITGRIRVDIGPDYWDIPIGEITFERSIPVDENSLHSIDFATFSVKYIIEETFRIRCHLVDFTSSVSPISLRCKEIQGERRGGQDYQTLDKEKIISAIADLSDLVIYFYHNHAGETARRFFRLDDLLGERFFTAKSVYELMKGVDFKPTSDKLFGESEAQG